MTTERDNNTTSQAIENLQKIKNGEDIETNRSEPTRLEKVQNEVDRLFEEHDMPTGLTRDCVTCYIADWDHRIGNVKYNTYIEEREYGKRVTGREHKILNHSIGIAKRAFDANDEWIDTVAHELSHVTAYVKNDNESAGHGQLWKDEAERLGADPSRCGSISSESQTEPNYYLGCPDGCFKNGKQRRSKRVKYPHKYYCPKCERNCVSWVAGEDRPSDGGTCAVEW